MRIQTEYMSFKICWMISSCYDFQEHQQRSQRRCCFSQTALLWFEVLPDLSPALPGLLLALPGTPRLVVGAPSHSECWQDCPPKVWYSPEIDASKFTLHILSDTPGDFQWQKYILLMHLRGDYRRRHTLDDVETRERQAEKEVWCPVGHLGHWRLDEPHWVRGSAGGPQTRTAKPNCCTDGHLAWDAHWTGGGAEARDEIVVGGKGENAGCIPPGWPTVGQGHHRHGCTSGGWYRMGSDRGQDSEHQGCWPGGVDTCRPGPGRWTREGGGAPTAAASKAAEIIANARTKIKPNPQAESSTSTGTRAGTNTNHLIGAERGDVISADTAQTMGDGHTTKLKDAVQPSPNPDDRLEHSRHTPNAMERRECSTPQ